MGRIAAKATRIYANEHNLSGKSRAAEMVIDNGLPEVTCFGDTAQEWVEALYGSKITQNSFFDGDSGEIDEQMWDEIANATAALLGLYPDGADQGDVGFEMKARVEGDAKPLEVMGAILLNVEWQGTGAVVRSTVLANGAVTGSGVVSGSNKNVGATSSGTTYVQILRVLSVSGSGSITVDVEGSSDDGGGDAYASIQAFTAKTGIGVERLTQTTATEAWKRVNVTAFSGFTSVTILVVVGKEQGT